MYIIFIMMFVMVYVFTIYSSLLHVMFYFYSREKTDSVDRLVTSTYLSLFAEVSKMEVKPDMKSNIRHMTVCVRACVCAVCVFMLCPWLT